MNAVGKCIKYDFFCTIMKFLLYIKIFWFFCWRLINCTMHHNNRKWRAFVSFLNFYANFLEVNEAGVFVLVINRILLEYFLIFKQGFLVKMSYKDYVQKNSFWASGLRVLGYEYSENLTGVTINAYISLLLWSTHINGMKLHIEMTRWNYFH